MTVASTYRADARVALKAYLDAFKAANPTLLTNTYRARPAGLNPPCAFVGQWREPTVGLDMQLMTRQPQVELVLVQGEYSNEQTMDRQDVLTDAFLSYLANNPYVGPGVILSLGTEDRDLEVSGVGGSSAKYLLTVVTVTLDLQEGL